MRGGLRQKLFWVVTLIALVPLLGLSSMGYLTARGELVASVRQNLRGLARLQVLQLNDYFRERRRQLHRAVVLFGESQRSAPASRPTLHASGRSAEAVGLPALRKEIRASAVGWVDSEGRVKGWVGDGRPKKRLALQGSAVRVLGVYHFSKVSETVVRMAAPLKGRGWLLIDFPFSIHQRFLQEKQAPAFRGDILLLNREQRVMCGSFDLKHSHHLFGSLWKAPRRTLQRGGWERVHRYRNTRGQDVFGVALPMKEVPWLLLIELPVSRALSSLYSLRDRGVLLLVVCVLLLLGVVAWSARRMEREQSQLMAQLVQREKMAAIGLMATGVAHEIGNPLASMTVLIQRLLMGKHGDADQQRLEELDERSQTIARILETMRDYAREKSAHHVPLDVARELQRAVSLVRFDRRLHEIDITQDISADLPMVWGHEDALQQVFTNLLLNAIDAIDEKHTADADTSGERSGQRASLQRGQISIKAWPTSDGLLCRVCDNGIGFGPGDAEAIFAPFVTTKTHGKGTGLGLTVSQQMVRDMGGEIRATRREGETCIELKLPLRADNAPAREDEG